jgi:hypothetical protein
MGIGVWAGGVHRYIYAEVFGLDDSVFSRKSF